LLVSIGTGLQEYVTNQFQSLGANSVYVMPGKVDLKNMQTMGESMLTSKLETTDVGDIERGSTLLSEVSPAVAAAGLITYRGKTISTEIAGVWENYFSIQNFTPLTGDLIRQTDVERSRKVIVLGDKPAKDLFGDTDPVGKWVTVGDIRYQVKGRLEEKGGGGAMGASMDDHAFIPYTTAMRQYNYTNPQMIVIKVVDQKSVEEASLDVKRVLLRRLKEDDFTVTQQTELLSTITQFLSVITVALGGIAAISLLVGGIGIMNIMLVSVTERTREIGLRKAVGATPQDILLQFLIEATILSLFGGIIGISLGMLGSLALNALIKTYVSIWSILLASGFSALIGILFGVAPAYRASKLDPIEALRYE
ncbi:MAG TPA: ABC transporter permease, partial [Candidatus Wunengus sp. YC60]|uniref:ABC transporter permease n=1 Tax=Candidatus Wunengus sp. YC60 TaxID=3367697 RepID=UPI004027BD55